MIGNNSKNDIYYSTGGGPDVLAAAALSCYGGQIQGRLILMTKKKYERKNWVLKIIKENIILKTW